MRYVGLCMTFLLAVTTLGCSQMVEVKQDFDHYADFESFKTYDWLSQPGEGIPADSEESVERFEFLDTTIREAVRKQLTAKGFTETTENPDILVVYYLGLQDKLGYADFNLDYSTEFRNSDVWHMGGAVLVIELINKETDHLVWRGQGEGAVNVDPTPEMVKKNVNRAVEKIFDQYPPKTLGDR